MATTEKMTAHKCLAELKVLNDRITNAITYGVYCASNKHSNTKIAGVPVEEYKKKMIGDYDKVISLIARKNAMKKALDLSNARTMVKINDVEYTIVEAIYMKNHGMEMQQYLLSEMKRQYAKEQKYIADNNGDRLALKAEKYIVEMYGNSEDIKKGEEAEKTRKAYIDQHTFDFVDAIGIVDKMEKLSEEITAFLTEVDAALSVVNATTEIEFSY